MRQLSTITALVALLFLMGAPVLGEPEEVPGLAPAFRTVDLWLTTTDTALVAYQVEIRYDRARMKIVGLEGGADSPFDAPPHYDPAGLTGGRLVVAALTADDENAPRGRIRVARLHLFVEDADDAPPLAGELVTAARPGGDRITPKVEILPQEGR